MSSEIGEWEKHTKGIGSKLLQKFGFKGRLGAREDGVSQAIEVVVRPTNVGLGFGDTVEASSLLVNKKIEAEWRGLEFNEADYVAGKKRSRSKIEQLASSQQWKRGKVKSDAKKTLSAEEFMEQHLNASVVAETRKQVIIDMRYEDTRILTDLTDINNEIPSDGKFKPLLGQEFLYNINLICDMQEMEASKLVFNLKNQADRHRAYQHDIIAIESEINSDSKRLESLKSLNAVLTRVESKIHDESISLQAVCNLMKTIYENFREEFFVFGLINMVPGLLNQKMNLEKWIPLENPGYLLDILDEWSILPAFFDEQGQNSLAAESRAIFSRMIMSNAIPVVRREITNNWSITSPDQCVKLFEGLQIVLPSDAFEELVTMLIIPKLQQCVENWTPSLKTPTLNGAVSEHLISVHHWIHPWLPLLRSKLSILYPDIRRKMSSSLNKWSPPSASALEMIQPWINIFDAASMSNLVVRSVIPRLVESLRNSFEIDPAAQDLAIYECVSSWKSLIPRSHYVCLFVGEVLTKWFKVLISWLTSGNCDFAEVSQWYSGWKSIVPEDMATDSLVLAPFDLALDLMQQIMMSEEGADPAETLLPFSYRIKQITSINYFELINEKKAEALAIGRLNDIKKDLTNLNRLSAGQQPTRVAFKTVVESFAEKNGVEFVPKNGKYHEGQQVWSFGDILCYMDQNVLFVHTGSVGSDASGSNRSRALEGSNWLPMSLEDLLARSRK